MKNLVVFLAVSLYLIGCELDGSSSEKMSTEEKLPYELIVDISNLEGSLVLALNGERLQAISDSDFSNSENYSMIGRFDSGQSYSLEVIQQPDSQYCSARYSNGTQSGVFTTEDITVFFTCQSYYRGLQGVTAVSAGWSHTCAIANNQVVCWGDNDQGQLNAPEGIINPTMIASGMSHTCVLEESGVICWGGDRYPELQNPPQNLSNVNELKSGAGYSCLIDDSGLRCWGAETVVSTEKVLNDPYSLSVYDTGACVVDAGSVKCWGGFTIGIGNYEPGANAITIGEYSKHCVTVVDVVTCYEAGGNVVDSGASKIELLPSSKIEFSQSGACALTDGRLNCWGSDFHGLSDIQYIVEFPDAITLGRSHGCAIEGNELICVGSNYRGEIEIPNT